MRKTHVNLTSEFGYGRCVSGSIRKLRLLTIATLALACQPEAKPNPDTNALQYSEKIDFPDGTPHNTALNIAQKEWLNNAVSAMTPREKLGQMLMVWVLGDYTANDDSSLTRLVSEIQDLHIGGVVVSLGSPIEVAAKLNHLQKHSKIPLLVASDLEPGLGRLEGGVFATSPLHAGTATVLPSNMAIGAGSRIKDAEEAGIITGKEALAVGIHLVFAPVADVNNNPSNPVINTRSFGESSEQTANLTAAFVKGVQSTGAAATLKHFPGHGDTDVDSHLGLPIIHVNRTRLDSIELPPFIKGIEQGVAAVMTAHIALPEILGDSVPATLKREIMTNILRDSLGFNGLTITDAMTMEGLAAHANASEAAVSAVEAGNDILLMPTDVRGTIDALEEAINSGRISQQRIDSSVYRILETKLRSGAFKRPLVNIDSVRYKVGISQHKTIADTIASRAITLLKDDKNTLPLNFSSQTVLIVYAADNDVMAGSVFASTLSQSLPQMRTIRVSPRSSPAELDRIKSGISPSEKVIVYTYTRTLEGNGRLAISQPIGSFIESLAQRKEIAIVAGGNPYVIRQFPSASTYLVTYGRGASLEKAAALALLGESAITGISPVSLPGFFQMGDGLNRSRVNVQ